MRSAMFMTSAQGASTLLGVPCLALVLGCGGGGALDAVAETAGSTGDSAGSGQGETGGSPGAGGAGAGGAGSGGSAGQGTGMAGGTSSEPCEAPVFFHDQFDTGDIVLGPGGWNLSDAGSGEERDVQTDRVRGGSHALRSTLVDEIQNFRVELAANTGGDDGFFEDQWYGESIYLENYEPNPNWEIHTQWHHKNDSQVEGYEGNPPVSLHLVNGEYSFARCWNPTEPTLDSATECESYDIGSQNDDAWTDWVFHIVWDYRDNGPSNVGLVEVWKNGEQVIDCQPPSCPVGYHDTKAPAWKMGIYRRRNSPLPVAARTIYNDEVRFATGPIATYSCVDPVAYAGPAGGGQARGDR